MKLLLKDNPEDTIILGIIRNILITFVTYIILFLTVTILFHIIKEKSEFLINIVQIIIIPGSIIISGIYNIIVLLSKSYTKAAKTNLFITLLVITALTILFVIIKNNA